MPRILAVLSIPFAGMLPAAASNGLADSFKPVDPARWHTEGGHTFASPGAGAPAVAVFTVPAGDAGFYAITDSRIQRESADAGRIELLVQVQRAGGTAPPAAVLTTLQEGEWFDFDAFLGYLDAGDSVRVSVGDGGDGPEGDLTEINCRVTLVPMIPVSVLDRGGSGEWSFASGVQADTPAGRHLAWNGTAAPTADAGVFAIPADGRESLAAFRVPQSGYYALHDTSLEAADGGVELKVFIAAEDEARRVVRAGPGGKRVTFNTDLGYIRKGECVYLVVSRAGDSAAKANLAASIVEWAPRRAPLRVRRGGDGLLDVLEPGAPLHAVDIPKERWVEVPAGKSDSTEAIRAAFARARSLQEDGGYAGVRLQKGVIYTVGSDQKRGALFAFRDTRRLVLDGNGATLLVAAPELALESVDLFSVSASRDLVFADLVVESTSIPFTTGEILDVSPRGTDPQTVTFRATPGEPDPIDDLIPSGRTNAYAYDPKIPGRLALGTWTHYPGSGNPSLQKTAEPGIFTHRVTRTGNSIEPGGRWLVKNKPGGLIYLQTRTGAENITLSGIDGRAAGGGTLRFWQTSGINILDCTFEPQGTNWISSSADEVHGRGREGVWIEDTLIRGVCEDIMNTYGQNMAIESDGDSADAVISLRMFERNGEAEGGRSLRMPREENVAVGDQLVFFDPNTGRVLGYADVVSIAGGRYTLSNPVTGVVPWKPSESRATTMIYNTRVAGRFFVRDSRFMDSMRFGIYIKARGGVVFNTQFEGLSGPSIFATNEPEWPEGPPATHLWVQGCTFSQNNFGFMPRHRDFMVVDPADISVYTRRFRQPSETDDHRAHLTRAQYANSHMKFLGNVFHDWRGMGISVRNSKNVRIEDNVFFPPAEDSVMRETLSADPALNTGGRGAFAAIHLDSVAGVRVSGNTFVDLPEGDIGLARGEDVRGVVATDNSGTTSGTASPTVRLTFDEWFGTESNEPTGIGAAIDHVAIGSATHRSGRLGAGLHFANGARAALVASADFSGAVQGLGIALWAQPDATRHPQVLAEIGDNRAGARIEIAGGRWRAGVWQGATSAWLDLGPARAGDWQHVAISFDGSKGVVDGYVDGDWIASANGLPAEIELPIVDAPLGGAYGGALDEVRIYKSAIGPAEIAPLALRAPAAVR